MVGIASQIQQKNIQERDIFNEALQQKGNG